MEISDSSSKPLRIEILNGPNLNLLGLREPHLYGNATFASCYDRLCRKFPQLQLTHFQSNIEGELISRLHQAMHTADGVVLNAGGYTHTSVAIADAVKAIGIPVIEVHITNIYAREEIRKHSLLAEACRGSICGLGTDGYRLAIEALLHMLQKEPEEKVM